MFRFTPRASIGAFSMFMIQEKKNPVLTALPVSQRGKKLGEMYRALTPKEIEKLTVKAKKYKPSRAAVRRKALRLKHRSQLHSQTKLRGAAEYNRFLKVMYERYARVPEAERFEKLLHRFERTYGKPLSSLTRKTKRSSKKAKSMKKAIKKKAAAPKVHKKKVKSPKKKALRTKKSHAKKALRKRRTVRSKKTLRKKK